MDPVVAPLWMYAKKKNQYEVYAASGTTYWQSTTLFKAVVPTDRRWILIGGIVNRNVSSTLIITIRDASNNVIMTLDSQSAATGGSAYPNNVAATAITQVNMPIILDEAEYINIAFGTAQDTGSYASCVILEVYKA